MGPAHGSTPPLELLLALELELALLAVEPTETAAPPCPPTPPPPDEIDPLVTEGSPPAPPWPAWPPVPCEPEVSKTVVDPLHDAAPARVSTAAASPRREEG